MSVVSDLEALLEAVFNFRQMATILGVSERTIRHRRELFGLPIGDNFSHISDHDLDGIVAGILQVSSIVTVIDYVSSHFNVFALVYMCQLKLPLVLHIDLLYKEGDHDKTSC